MTSTTPGPAFASSVAASRQRRYADELDGRLAGFAARTWRAAKSGAPALALVYLVLIWAIFAGVLLSIPERSGGLGARVLAGLSGL